MAELRIFRLAERPELGGRQPELDAEWPAFVHHDPTGLFYGLSGFSEYILYAVAGDQDVPVGRAQSVPFYLAGGPLSELPDDGLNEVVRWAARDQILDRPPNIVSSVEVVVRSDWQRRGVGTALIRALRENARRLGFDTLAAPVRPIKKHTEPHTPLDEYAFRQRPDGLPMDPWLRAHVRLGAEIVKIAPYSMTVPGTLEQWRQWSGLPFDKTVRTVVPHALVPVLADFDHKYAVYVEPNVWVRHRL